MGGGVKPSTKALLLGLAALLALTAAWAVGIAYAQNDDEQAGRIVARRLDDGRTEFGWQPAGGARVLPSARYFPADAPVNRWLNSSPVEIGGAELGRINARLRSDGRIEFAFTPTDGKRIEPPARYFPANARVGHWLRSTTIAIDSTPPPPESSSGFSAVAAGGHHTCGLRNTGAIECWGRDTQGQTAAPAGRFTAVSTGKFHTCAIRESDSAIECWGWNLDWKLIYVGQATPPAGSFAAVSTGHDHTCAIRASSAIECWGSNSVYRPLAVQGEGEEIEYEAIPAGQADAPAGAFRAVAAGLSHSCGVRESGAIECWGNNDSGQSDAPAGAFRAVSAGVWHTCAIRESGTAECWGWSGNGEADAPAGAFRAVAAGVFHTCGVRDTGAIECWGGNYDGQTDAPAGSDFIAVSAGELHSCGVRESGAIQCWGNNEDGQTATPAP